MAVFLPSSRPYCWRRRSQWRRASGAGMAEASRPGRKRGGARRGARRRSGKQASARRCKMAELATRFERIMFDPLSYIHPQRLCLPQQLDTPRQRAALNDMLLGGFGLASGRTAPSGVAEQQLIMHWQHLPYVCMLVGAQLLKSELARRGRFVQV